MLLKEPNYTRKAQRVDLPLLVQIGGASYKTKDWSLAGVGILDLGDTFQKEQEIDCRLVLPLEGANFVLPATLVVRNKRSNITGCEFKNLAPKNKRVLRRFIELAIEGQIDNVEDFIAAYSEPVFETPINEAITLEEKESRKIKKTFIQKSLAYLFVGVVVSLVVGYTTVYNLQYKVFATGVVTGGFVKITANNSGILDKIHVDNHDAVDKGLVLFDIAAFETIKQPRAVPDVLQTLQADVENGIKPYVSDVLDVLKERKQNKQREYDDAKVLYDRRLITLKDFNIVYNTYIKAKIDYERERDRVREENERRRSQLAALREKIEAIKTPAFETVTLPALKRRVSPIAGAVYRIERGEGEFMHPDQTVMILQTNETPFVVLKLHSRDIYKVKINDTALIYSKYNNLSYRGLVTQIGYAAVNADATISQESSLNESLVKIEFLDDHVAFPLNTRVEVRIKRDFLQG